MHTDIAWAASIRRTRHIGDFSNWKEHDSYQAAFQRLLRDLKAQIIEGLGHGLNEKAVEAVTQWRFKPALKNEKPVKCGAVVTITFRL